jgi:hypothetical protein
LFIPLILVLLPLKLLMSLLDPNLLTPALQVVSIELRWPSSFLRLHPRNLGMSPSGQVFRVPLGCLLMLD